MATMLKCKMCGGDVEATTDMTVGKCLYCGSTMTLPRIESDKKVRLFNKANEYRLNNEFDKAYDAYKSIVEEDEQEAEAYWGMILSEYGIEYVEDAKTHKRVATCHRTHVQNIQNSTNYEMALKYADAERRFMYQDEAEALDKLQHNILAVSAKEEDYDVFICYKESGDDGQRTKDSVLAQEIYDELEKNQIRTFFARISLEEHIGVNYEPYIYAALTSAKVMLMVSTSGEHCDAVWVKNEWKRFLAFMENDPSKSIIPVFKEMSPYEFPSELSGFQAQDMGKIGAIQDLVRGVKKLLGKTAGESRNQVLDELVLREQKRDAARKKRAKFFECAIKLLLKRVLPILVVGGFVVFIVILGKNIYKKYVYPAYCYNKAIDHMENEEYEEAIEMFRSLDGYKLSDEKIQECKEGIKENQYQTAMTKYNAKEYEVANKIFGEVQSYKDATEMRQACQYYMGVEFFEQKEYEKATSCFYMAYDYEDAYERYKECLIEQQLAMDKGGNKETIKHMDLFNQRQAYRLAVYFYDKNDCVNGLKALAQCGVYEDSVEMAKEMLFEKYVNKVSSRNEILKSLPGLIDGSTVAELLSDESVKDGYRFEKAEEAYISLMGKAYNEIE